MCKTITGDSTQKICVHIGKAHTINNAYLLNVRIFFIYFNFPFFFLFSVLCFSFIRITEWHEFIQYELKQFIIALDSFKHSAHRIGSNYILTIQLTQSLRILKENFEFVSADFTQFPWAHDSWVYNTHFKSFKSARSN